VKVYLSRAHESVDDLQCLLEPVDQVVEGITERSKLSLFITAAQTKDQPTAADFIDGIGHLG
jgi:hypothetical protein